MFEMLKKLWQECKDALGAEHTIEMTAVFENKDFDFNSSTSKNELGVTEYRYFAEGICPNCKEKTNASIIIPEISENSQPPKFIAVCDKCNKEFIISSDHWKESPGFIRGEVQIEHKSHETY